MATIAIRKYVDGNQTVMIAGDDLGRQESFVLNLDADITLVDTDCYGQGWLYQVRGTPEPNSVDVKRVASRVRTRTGST